MAAGIGAGAGAGGSVSGHPRSRRAGQGGAGFRLLCWLLLAFCASCTSSRREAQVSRAVVADTLLLKPVDRGRFSSTYGMRYHPILKRREMHRGIDWAAPRGTPVRAAGHGTVVAAAAWGSYGHYLRIEHGGRGVHAVE